jgi:hypothetical protein
MLKNPKFLYGIIALLIVIVVLIGGFIALKDSSVFKSDDQKWSILRSSLQDDADSFANYKIKKEDFANQNYDKLKDINCSHLTKLSDQEKCKPIQDVVVRQIEKPETINKGDWKYKNDELESKISNITVWSKD